MAFWVLGGGEQTLGPCDGEENRPYYVHDALHQQKRRQAVDADDELRSVGPHGNGFAELQAKHYLMTRLGPAHPAVLRQQIPERDVPYPSIEPRDTPTPAPEEAHVFFILHEEGSDAPKARQSFSSQSPLPVRDDFSASPALMNWSNGSDLRAFATTGPHYSPQLVPAQAPKLQRYEDWRDMNRSYGMVAEQEEDSRSFSPFILLPPAPDLRQTPEIMVPHLHPPSAIDRWHRQDARGVELPHGHESDTVRPYHQHGQQSDLHMVQSLSCSIRDPDAHSLAETFMTDAEAAASVTSQLANFNRRCPSSRHERILLGLIHPKTANAEFDLDNSALESIFSSANEIFFNGRLTQRVQWDWSDAASNPQYDNKIIGHTSLRRAHSGGFETFVLLSTPILRSREYSRRLLISAFLHELIHCYLFICCGWAARESGGHTDGFRRIADTIDNWAGRENLFLCQVEADLERFRQPPEWSISDGQVSSASSSSLSSSESYSGYSLASPVFYDASVCCPTKTNTDWERCIHDRWEEHHRDGQSDRTFSWA